MTIKRGFSLEEHREAGRLIKQAYENIIHLSVKFANAYGKTKEPYLSIQKAEKALLIVKSNAEDVFFKDNPDKDKSPYFGAIEKPGE